MPVGGRLTPALAILALLACGRSDRVGGITALERAIAADLGRRFGTEVPTRCFRPGPVCAAQLPDGGTLPISVSWSGGEWRWRVLGLVITTDTLEAFLRAEVAELGAAQAVHCTPRIRRIQPGEQIECGLAHGGKAFVMVRADGTTSVEIVLDPAAARARSEPDSPEHDRALTTQSQALEHAADTDDPEADVGGGNEDAGLAPPAPATDPR